MVLNPLRWESALHVWWHEEGHLLEVQNYVKKRIGELEALWTKEALSEEELGKRIDELIKEGSA